MGLQGFVARPGVVVEGGVKHDSIETRLQESVAAGVGRLNIELASRLAPFGGVRFTDLYYLPGTQKGDPSPGVIRGTTADDITIVLQS